MTAMMHTQTKFKSITRLAAGALLLALAPALVHEANAQAIRTNTGFTSNALARNDDGSTAAVPMGFTINFFGLVKSTLFVNNNGNVTFDSALATFTPFPLQDTTRSIIAPFFADVDTTNPSSGVVQYGTDTVNGRPAFGVNWFDAIGGVGYYSGHADKRNMFQLVLIDRSDTGSGNFDFELNYSSIQWETGDLSGGTGGLGGNSARVGYSNGSNASFELPGSAVNGAFLNGGPNALASQGNNSTVIGRTSYSVRNGAVVQPAPQITSPDAVFGQVGTSFSYQIGANNSPTSYSATNLPPGLSVNTSTGRISGVPTQSGRFNVTINATNSGGTGSTLLRMDITTAGAPFIGSPLAASATVGIQFIYQFQTTGATSLSVTDLPPGFSYNSTLRAIVGTPTTAGTYQLGLNASNSSGTSSTILTIGVRSLPSAGPVIRNGTSVTVRTGTRFNFQVYTTGGTSGTRLNVTNLPPGLTFDPLTGLISGTVTVDGSYGVNLTVSDGGSVFTSTIQITFSSNAALPVIVSSTGLFLTPGQQFNYQIQTQATGNDPIVYTLLGNLPPGLGFNAATGTISGTYTPSLDNPTTDVTNPNLSGGVVTNVQLFATNSQGTTTVPPVFFVRPPGVANISTRLSVGADPNVLIGGFIITGNAPKKVIIRAIAPSLSVGGVPVPGTLPDPTLELVGPGISVMNDDWRATQEQEIVDTTVPPTNNLESALVATLNPGNYTAIVRGKNGQTGIGLVEVFDLGTASLENSSNAKLANISTRGFVRTGDDVMIGGFIISGATTRVIVRAIGPDLTNRGVPGALQDTILELNGANGLVASNDDWETTQRQEIINTTVPPNDPRESAIVANLAPGNYTAVVRGKNGGTGVALVEVFALQ